MSDVLDRIHKIERFGIVLGLERVEELLRRLGDPHKDLKCIHVAGTNGKGSTCKYLEQGLAACGYKMGLYISPFIEVFNERISCEGEYITDEEIELYGNMALEKVDEMVAEGQASPTEFEVVMAMAFLYFRDKAPDIVILETGMGGVGDATNVIARPMASVITNVAFDHMAVLGNTLGEIAHEKAGIIKPGAPVISNVADHEAAVEIAAKAYKEGCQLYDVSKIKYNIDWQTPFQQQVSMSLWHTDYSEVITSMVGRHQAENLKTALATIEVLRKAEEIKVERSQLYSGLKKAVQIGRLEVVQDENPMIILDGAHNDDGARAFAETTKGFFADKKVLLVTGMLADKETDKIIAHFTEVTDNIIATQPLNPRRLTADELADKLEAVGIKVKAKAETVEDAVKCALKMKEEYDVILFAGSLYLIGDVRRMLRNELK